MDVASDLDAVYIVCHVGIQSLGGCPFEELLDGSKILLLGTALQDFLTRAAKALAVQIFLISEDVGALRLLDLIPL